VGATFFSPLTGFFIYSGSLLLVTLFSGASLHFFSFWIDPSHFFVIATVIYYLVIPYRLVLEYQRRAHFQEKSIWMTKAEEAKRNFFSLVSHDLKTPISRIQGAAELLLQKIEPHQASEKKSLDAILETTASLNDYVEAVFDLARLESSNAPLQKTSRDLNSVIKEVIDNKEYLASEKEIQLHSIQEPLFSVDMDVKLIKRAIANVLENAIKYSPRGSLISLKSGESKGYVFVSIQDQGIGINPEEQEKVFERFYRGKQVKDSPTKGTGLGLYLVKYFVELHKGVVELKSRPEVGSTFTIFLPV
jgi:signal transduction histidine kinase